MKDSEKTFTVCYTNLMCISCKKSITRKSERGDTVFEICGVCDECEGSLRILKIFGEIIGRS